MDATERKPTLLEVFMVTEACGTHMEQRDQVVANTFVKVVDEFAEQCREHGFRQIVIPCLPAATGIMDKYRAGRSEQRAGVTIKALEAAGYTFTALDAVILYKYAGMHWEEEPMVRFTATLLLDDVSMDSERQKAALLAKKLLDEATYQLEGAELHVTVAMDLEMPPPAPVITDPILATVYGHDRKDYDEPFNTRKQYIYANDTEFAGELLHAVKRLAVERWNRHPDITWNINSERIKVRKYSEGMTSWRRWKMRRQGWRGLDHVKAARCSLC